MGSFRQGIYQYLKRGILATPRVDHACGTSLLPFYRVSDWLQDWFLTKTPTDVELEVAECAFHDLMEAIAEQSLLPE